MDPTTIGLLATAISAPICAAILKLVPQRGVMYDGPATETLLTKQLCIAHRAEFEARLTRTEGAIRAIQSTIYPTQQKETIP